MRNLYLCLIVLAVSGAARAQNYTVLGNASPMAGCNCFQLTPDANDQHSAIFQNQTINLNNSFDYTFNVFLGCGGSSGADGICFVLTSNPQGLGNAGEGLGYAGPNQPFSLAVEFDTWQNGSPANDPPYDHIGIESGGLYNHNVAGAVPAVPSQANIDDCNWHTVRIVWDVNTNTFSVYFDGVLRQSIVIPNIAATYFGGNPIVNWGWTGATGGGTNLQQVCILSTSSWVGGINYQSCTPTMQFNDVSTSNVGTIQSWAWNFGDGTTSSSQNPLHTFPATGTYTVSLTITDNQGCSTTYSHTVTINPPITLAQTLVAPTCNGASNGNITVAASGGFGVSAGYGGYAYSWNDGTQGTTDIGVTAGTYTVTCTDGVCTATGQYTLNQPPAVTASTSHTDANCNLANGSLSITIQGGTLPYGTVTWYPTTTPTAFTGTTVSNVPADTYQADFSDANGCSALLTYTETVANLPCGYNVSTSHTDVTCYGAGTGSATVTASGGVAPWTYSWSNGGSTATISNLPAGTYNYSIHDANNQTFTGTVVVNQPSAPIVANIDTVPTSCANTNDGQAIASVLSGGSSPFNYTWNPAGPNSPVDTGLNAGAVSVTVTDANGCTATAASVITGPVPLALSITPVDDSCYQSRTGSAAANVTGGNSPYTYYWSNISSAQTDLSLGQGTYTVTVTDNKGCSVTGTTTIGQASPFTHTLTHTDIQCNGANNGTITVTANGGTPAYTYTWNPSTAAGSNPTNLNGGQYNLTLTDSHNCAIYDSVVITQPAQPLTVTTSHTDVRCSGGSDGVLILAVAGGTSPYTFTPTGGPTLPITANDTVTGRTAGTYTGTVTDANGCTQSVTETINEPAAQSVAMSKTDAICNGSPTGSASANFVNPTGSVTYNWSPSGTGATLSNIVAGTYDVTATDANGCSLTGTTTVNQPAAPVMTTTVVDATCYAGNGSITANPSGGGAFTYIWSSGNATTQTVQLPAGSYTVTASDANSCYQTASFTVNQPTDITIQETHTDINCYGDSTGSIQLTVSGGTGPNYTYGWAPNVSTTNIASQLVAGNYDITVTDQANCTKNISIALAQPAQPLTINIQSQHNISCYNGNDGSIIAQGTGGTPGYIYTWNPAVGNDSAASNLSANTYNITVTDTKSCNVQVAVTLSQPNQPLTLTPSQTNLTCYHSNDGTATVNVIGGTFPYTYNWTNNVSTDTIATSLAAGSYSVTVTDNNNCTNTTSYTLTEPTQLTATATPVDVLCHGSTTGSVTVSATGGTPGTTGYTYTWTPNVSSSDNVQNVGAGTYTILVTDSNNCTASVASTITEPPALVITANATPNLCFDDSTGAITVVASGGVPAYNYSVTDNGVNIWNNTNGQFNGLHAGNYTATIIDQNQCSSTTNVILTQPSQLTETTTPTDATCFHYTDGQLNVTTSGGTPVYSFTLSNGEVNSTGNFAGLAASDYQVTITDANGCNLADSGTISEPDSVIIEITPSPTEVKLGESIQLNTTTNQSGPVEYTWTPPFGLSCYDCSNPVFDGVYTQLYNLIATTAAGCIGTDTVEITVVPNYDIFFPNAFTPNGDGQNDEWQMFTSESSIKQVNVEIFNRIGEKVFESNDIGFKWNGLYKGKDAPSGIYVYHVKIVWLNNHSDSKYVGSITLLR